MVDHKRRLVGIKRTDNVDYEQNKEIVVCISTDAELEQLIKEKLLFEPYGNEPMYSSDGDLATRESLEVIELGSPRKEIENGVLFIARTGA